MPVPCSIWGSLHCSRVPQHCSVLAPSHATRKPPLLLSPAHYRLSSHRRFIYENKNNQTIIWIILTAGQAMEVQDKESRAAACDGGETVTPSGELASQQPWPAKVKLHRCVGSLFTTHPAVGLRNNTLSSVEVCKSRLSKENVRFPSVLWFRCV